MDDMERYGDYNEVDESPKGSPAFTVLKILVSAICLLVAGVIAFRIVLFNYYPSKMKSLYVDDRLTAAYAAGTVTVKTQELRYGYDDPDLGNFFADYLYVIDELGRVQITLRCNDSVRDRLNTKYGADTAPDGSELPFTFALYRNNLTGTESGDEYVFYERDKVGELVSVEKTTVLMYTYYRLVFDNVDFDGEEDNDPVKWLSVAALVGNDAFTRILIYENNETYATFEDYRITEGELK